MRATAPSGDARFEGVVGWSGELGYGLRAPEAAQDAKDAVTTHAEVIDEHGHGPEPSGHAGHDGLSHDETDPHTQGHGGH
jgi:hypothetical protein